MERSETAAMLVCVAFSVAISVVIHQSEPRQLRMTSPLGTSAVAARPTPVLPAIGPASAGDAGRRETWVRKLTRPNTMDTQSDVNRTTRNQLALLPPAELAPGGQSPLALPPLVVDDGIVVASVDSSEQELPPEMVEPTVLVSSVGLSDAASEVAATAQPKVYEVAKGDTLSKITRREWNSNDPRLAALLVEANPKVRDRKGVIRAGEEILIPDAGAVQRVLAGVSPRVALAPAMVVGTGSQASAGAPATASEQWYTIQRNDTLATIAKRFLKDSQRWREILALNQALDPLRIAPGMRIKLPPVLRIAQG